VYKPNFCVECGARIERARWHWWTNRRFCVACASRSRKSRLLLPLIVCATLLVAGYIAGRVNNRADVPPLIIERGSQTLSAALPTQAAESAVKDNLNKPGLSEAGAGHTGAAGAMHEQPTESGEVVSICGARTKKGTPCSRRVRGTGRCWQHRGKSAMLPTAKLVVSG